MRFQLALEDISVDVDHLREMLIILQYATITDISQEPTLTGGNTPQTPLAKRRNPLGYKPRRHVLLKCRSISEPALPTVIRTCGKAVRLSAALSRRGKLNYGRYTALGEKSRNKARKRVP